MEEYIVEFTTSYTIAARSEDEAKEKAAQKLRQHFRIYGEDTFDIFESYVS